MKIESLNFFESKPGIKNETMTEFKSIKNISNFLQNPPFISVSTIYQQKDDCLYIDNEHIWSDLESLKSIVTYPPERGMFGFWKIKYKNN